MYTPLKRTRTAYAVVAARAPASVSSGTNFPPLCFSITSTKANKYMHTHLVKNNLEQNE